MRFDPIIAHGLIDSKRPMGRRWLHSETVGICSLLPVSNRGQHEVSHEIPSGWMVPDAPRRIRIGRVIHPRTDRGVVDGRRSVRKVSSVVVVLDADPKRQPPPNARAGCVSTVCSADVGRVGRLSCSHRCIGAPGGCIVWSCYSDSGA